MSENPLIQELKKKLDDNARRIQRKRYLQNYLMYAKEVLGYTKLKEYPHGEISGILDAVNGRTVEFDGVVFGKPYKLINMPRGSFKSSEVTIGKTLHRALVNPDIRVLIDSETYSNAVKYVKAIRSHCEENEKHVKIFGRLGYKGGPTTWNEDEITLLTRQKTYLKEPSFSASGIDSPRTGMHYDLIVADDLHSENNTRTKEQVDKVLEHLMLLFNLLDPDGELWVLGTRWSLQDIYGYIIENFKNEFDIYKKSSYEPEGSKHGKLLLPDVLTEESLNIKRKIMTPEMFSGQLLNEPISSTAAPFRMEDARFYERNDEIPEQLNICMTVDPAVGENSSSDYSAIVVAGKDPRNRIWELESWSGKVNPLLLILRVFMYHKKWNPIRVGVEKGAIQNVLRFQFDNEMQNRNYFFHIEELTGWTESSKGERIRRLEPMWRAHAIILKKGSNDLLDQFLKSQSLRHDDLIDAFAYQLEIQGNPVPPDEQDDPALKKMNERQAHEYLLSKRVFRNLDLRKGVGYDGDGEINDMVSDRHGDSVMTMEE